MIIVEGVDNTGKSTLIRQLKKEFPKLEEREGSRGPKDKKTMIEHLSRALNKPKQETIYHLHDRFPLVSEYVYGLHLRGDMVLEPKEYASWIQKLNYHRPLIIHCQPPLTVVAESFKERQQMDGVEGNLTLLYAAYQSFFLDHRRNFRRIIYDYTRDQEFERTTPSILGYLQEMGRQTYG